ncbi:histidine kinase dimerization/phosphoacceptor domain -containing protein [Pedobacter sp. Leaf194]|uniref:tetratricopeptide repeat-containing sensor histidine kinase n=1 Tax=Pedobacter sp. Leaf194 TaxID=1736297 RepID=UPI00138F0AE0|nr:histidine kinase dimerization/phosphoacceptor domain -containing protein [Pedobacter sp. Leaf194]
MKRYIFLLIVVFPMQLIAQARSNSFSELWLLSQLSLNYYTVVQEGLIEQDSSLVRVCQLNGVSRWNVLTQGIISGSDPSNQNWIDLRKPEIGIKMLKTLSGEEHIKMALLLGTYYAFEPLSSRAKKDYGLSYLAMAERESSELGNWFYLSNARCLMGKSYFKTGNVKEGITILNSLIASCEEKNDLRMQAKGYDYLGTYLPLSAQTIGIKLNSFIKSSKLYNRMHNIRGEINALQNLGYLFFVVKDWAKAETSSLRALELQQSIGFKHTHYTTDFLAFIADFKGNRTENLKYGLSSIKSSQATKDSLGLGYFYKRIGDSRFTYNDPKTRLAWYKQSLVQLLRNGERSSLYPVIHSISYETIEAGKSSQAIIETKDYIQKFPPRTLPDSMLAYQALGEGYYAVKNYKMAEKLLLEVERMGKRINPLASERFRTFNAFKLGHFYLLTKNYKKAKYYLELFKASSSEMPLNTSADAEMYMYKVDSALGNTQLAVKHLKDFLEVNSKVLDQSQTRIVENLRMQYQTAQKEMDIKLLKQETVMQKKQSSLIRLVAITVLTMAFLIIVLLLNQYRIKKRQKEEIDEKNKVLQHTISEKDDLLVSKQWLLKEVHHRVKNNLHTVISLLESQAHYLKGDALKAIQNSEHRIYAMSLIHQKLYQEDDVKTIDIKVYLTEFISYLKDSFGTYSFIKFLIEIEPIRFGVSRAIPIGLIVNEAVTNAIKYAFPDMEKGIILIRLVENEEGIELTIKDNGIGLNPMNLASDSQSLGLRLMRGLAGDLGGVIKISGKDGAEIKVSFERDQIDVGHI